MQNFYHPARRSREITELPAILGLTASPVTKANIAGLRYVVNLGSRRAYAENFQTN